MHVSAQGVVQVVTHLSSVGSGVGTDSLFGYVRLRPILLIPISTEANST